MKLKLLIAFFLPVTLLNAQIFFTEAGLDYRTDVNSTVHVVGSDCSHENLTIPDTVSNDGNTFTVTNIGDNAFASCTNLKNVTFPETLTFIGRSAFSGCTALEKINIPNTVIGVSDGAFASCTSLTEAVLNNTSRILSNGLFENCTSLTTVNIQPSVTIIEDKVFRNCTSLESITLHNNIEILGSSAFENSGLKNIDLPYIENIGTQVFSRTQITRIDFPSSYTDVPSSILSGCKELATVNLPNSIRTIGSGAFSGCDKLTSIGLPSNLINIESGAFSGCGFTSVTLPNTVKKLGSGAFNGCSDLETIIFSTVLEEIGSFAFQRCYKLTNFTLPNSLKEIGNKAFEQCYGITDLVIPNSVTDIRDFAFNRCFNLENVVLSTSLTALNQYVFNECRKLSAIEIPSSVNAISDFAFAKTKLRKVTINQQTPLVINANVFEEITLAFAELVVPSNTSALYEIAAVWKDFGTITENTPTVVNIPDSNFEQALVDKGIDSDGLVNGQVLESDIENIDVLDVSSRSISDLTGIEGFKSLETLFAYDNNLETVDLSANLALSGLALAFNNLSGIDVSNNTNLVSISLNNNSIGTLDLSSNLQLKQLNINTNALNAIQVNMLPMLEELDISANNLVELDLSNNTQLSTVFCQNNDLANLNVQNGNNGSVANTGFDASGNDNLYCIQVDDVDFSNTNWTNIDSQSFFGLDCAPANDGCQEATPLDLGPLFNSTSISATSSNANPNCQQAGLVILDVWFQFEAPNSESVLITAASFSGVVKFAIYEDCTSTTPIACSANELIQNGLTVGQTYFIQIWIEADLSGRKSTKSQKSQHSNQPGSFTIQVQDASSLSTSDLQNDADNVKLFPNPALNEFNMVSNSKIEHLSITDISGKLVYSNSNPNQRTLRINVNHFRSGLYLVNIKTNETVQTKKLIIK